MSILPADDFGALFRLLDDYDTHRSTRGAKGHRNVRAFQPKFDVRETKDRYELFGELPGADQKNIHLEFTDPQTMVVKGRVENVQQNGQTTPQKATVEDAPEDEGKEQQVSQKEQEAPQEKLYGEQYKYWIKERLVGEFHRSFSLPARIDQDNVKATLKNGILKIVVPKAPVQSRRIEVW